MSKQDPKSKKEKREKVVYIDDGATVIDMSGIEQTKKSYTPGAHRHPDRAPRVKPVREPSRFKACLRTYLESVKLMLLPMLAFLGVICILFLILWFLF